MTILFSNNASTTIAGSITATDVTVQMAAGTGILFPNPVNTGDYFCLTFYDQQTKTINEIVHCTARSGDTCTIVRGQENTTPNAWNAGDILANLITAGTLNAFVQAGTGPADTSILYAGIDVGTPNHIVCNTNPVPSNYAIDMVFTIQVNNDNTGPTDLSLNGHAAILAKRTDGSDFVGGEFTAGETYFFIYNGTFFTSTMPPVPLEPPQTVFYVRPDGNDNNSGFANTPSEAFATCQGCVNAIKKRYISQQALTVRVADGNYIGGWMDTGTFIAGWSFIGDTANPSNVYIDATSTNPAVWPPGAPGGIGVSAQDGAHISAEGFTFNGYSAAVAAFGGFLTLRQNNYAAPTSQDDCIVSAYNGNVYIGGYNTYLGGTCNALFGCGAAAVLSLGQYNPTYGSDPCQFFISSGSVFNQATGVCNTTGYMAFIQQVLTWEGYGPTGRQYYCDTAGGIIFASGNYSLPGSQPGQVVSPGWIGA